MHEYLLNVFTFCTSTARCQKSNFNSSVTIFEISVIRLRTRTSPVFDESDVAKWRRLRVSLDIEVTRITLPRVVLSSVCSFPFTRARRPRIVSRNPVVRWPGLYTGVCFFHPDKWFCRVLETSLTAVRSVPGPISDRVPPPRARINNDKYNIIGIGLRHGVYGRCRQSGYYSHDGYNVCACAYAYSRA